MRKAFGYVKKAAALANRDLGVLDAKVAAAIIGACDRLIAGEIARPVRHRLHPGRRRHLDQHERERAVYPGPIDHPDSLWLGLGYFGYTQNPGSNFVIGTLKGGKRDAQGLEFVFRKRFADRWQMLASYNWTDAKGDEQFRRQRRLPGGRGVPRSARAEPVRAAAGEHRAPGQDGRLGPRSTWGCSSAPCSTGTRGPGRAGPGRPTVATCRCWCRPARHSSSRASPSAGSTRTR